MKPLQLLFQSSIGKKMIMGATGAAMFLFVIGHLVGNLQVFLPKEHINAYAHLLHASEGLLWIIRLSLVGIVGLHVWSAVTLNAQNNSARPSTYGAGTGPFGASWASQYMFMTGLVIAAFVVYHLLHYTVQLSAINFAGKDFSTLTVVGGPQNGWKDVHQMLVIGFGSPIVSLFYLVAIGLLCIHLSHGASAMFQSLGIAEGAWRTRLEALAKCVSIGIFLGYASIPIAIFLRIVS